MLAEGVGKFARCYSNAPASIQSLRKNRLGWANFSAALMAHSGLGFALTFRGVQMNRPCAYELEDNRRQIYIPALVLIDDEDEPCIEPSIFMKRTIPACGLAVFRQSGHTINLEESDLFNRTEFDFLSAVEADLWAKRVT